MEAVHEGGEFPVVQGEDETDVADIREASRDRGRDAVRRVGSGTKDEEDRSAALAWFLSNADAGVSEHTFELNVGLSEERWIPWTVTAIAREELRTIRRMALPPKARASGQGEVDQIKVNLAIAARGTKDPDLTEAARLTGTPSVEEVLRLRFSHKPGLIDQIAAQVLTTSGYDDEDIRDVGAAKN